MKKVVRKNQQYLSSPQADLSRRLRMLPAAAGVLMLLASIHADAAESSKFRQPSVGAFGGEIAAPADNPGFFGTAFVTYTKIEGVVDDNGDPIKIAGRSVPLPTGTPTGGAIPNGTYSFNVPSSEVTLTQSQAQVNLVAGYLTESTYADGRVAFALNVPLVKQSREFAATPVTGTITPTPPAAMPAPLRGAISAVGAAVNTQVQAALAAQSASQNADASGLGDTEISVVWVRHQNQLKIAAGASLYAPTGVYDKTRGPNPGFGNFYTLRPGVAVTYAVNPDKASNGWDSGVTVAGRVSYGINTINKETDYKSGNFVYAETAISKVTGQWAFGANLVRLQQVSDDSGAGVPAGTGRYSTNSVGPFLSYKLPEQDAGFNLLYSQTFGGRNALETKSLQLRFIKAW